MKGLRMTTISVLAIGLLVGSAVGVPAQEGTEDPEAPVAFTGQLSFGTCPVAYTTERLAGKTEDRGGHYCRLGVVEAFSDPRLVGDYYVWNNRDVHDGGPMIYTTAFSIINEEGAWRGVPVVQLGPSKTDVLIGEGAYADLSVVATVDLFGSVWDWNGWIIEGGVPPLPTKPEGIR